MSLTGYFKYRKYVVRKKQKKTSHKDPLNEIYMDEISGKIINLFEVQKIYRRENLTLISLSKELSIQPYILSRIINEKLNKTFSQLLNYYRIKEAKQLLLESNGENQKKILNIAYSVGFGNKATFNKIFKKFTRQTPSQFKDSGKVL